MASPADRAPFPTDVNEFTHDERISYSVAENTYLLVDNTTGEEWEWNTQANRWHQPATEEQIAAMQGAYGDADEDEESKAFEANKKKRKAVTEAGNASKVAKNEPENRAIYIKNIPLDADREEIETVIGKYGGIIDQGVGGQKRVKMYADDKGEFNGEALVVFFKKESVQQAIRLLDDFEFRMGDSKHPKLSVVEADQSYRKVRDGKEIKFKRSDRKASERNRADLNRKLAEWSDDDEPAKESLPSKFARYVIIKHAFTLEELAEDVEAASDIMADMREEAEKEGDVRQLILFDLEPDGVMLIRFELARAAEEFVRKNNHRWFAGRRLLAFIPEDRWNFKKSAKKAIVDEDSDAERLERFGQALERK